MVEKDDVKQEKEVREELREDREGGAGETEKLPSPLRDVRYADLCSVSQFDMSGCDQQ